jgi:hypothetical protein
VLSPEEKEKLRREALEERERFRRERAVKDGGAAESKGVLPDLPALPRHAQPVDTSTSHVGLRCIVTERKKP